MMQTIFIDGRDYATAAELHDAIAMMLDFLEHYGRNADALNDCLGELGHPVRVIVTHMGEGEVAAKLEICLRVFEDNGGQFRRP